MAESAICYDLTCTRWPTHLRAIAGPIVEMDLRTLYLRDLTFIGCTVVAPYTFGKLVGYIERGEVSPILAATYPLAQLQEPQAQFIRKQHIGNIVVTMD